VAKQTINLGTQGTQSGDTVRTAFDKSNDNFDELYGAVQCVYHADQQGLSYSNSLTSYYSTATILSGVPAGTYVCLMTVLCSTDSEDVTGNIKLRTSEGDLGVVVKFTKNAQGLFDTGNIWWTNQRVVTLSSQQNIFGQYRRLSGAGSVSISGIQLTMIKIA
jgi:hypothetical protein